MRNTASVTRCLAVLGVLCIFQAVAAAQPSPANEVQVGPIPVTEPINGVSVTVPITSFMTVATSQNTLQFHARVVGDLSDLQSKSGTIIDTFPLPTDNCHSFSANNQVVKIWGKELIPSGNSAVLRLHGYVENWDCRENPIPNSKVEWRNDGPFHLSIPHVVTWPGNPIKNLLVTQPFDVSVPANIKQIDDQNVALELGTPTITLGGQFAGITNGILKIAGIDLNQRAKQVLDQAINPALLKQGIPPDYAKLNPKIESAAFVNDGGKLALEIKTSATVPGAQLTEFLSAVARRTP